MNRSLIHRSHRRAVARRLVGLVFAAMILVGTGAFVGCASAVRVMGPAIGGAALYRARCDERVIALTLDDGPVSGSTEGLLEVLDGAGAHATFFLIGERAELHGELVEAIVAHGHEIANHTLQETPTLHLPDGEARDSIERTHAILSAYADIHWFRPGSARYNDEMLEVADDLGYEIALGDTFPYDTFITSTRFHAWYIRRSVRPGSIIVLHNAHGRGVRAARTLGQVLPLLQEDGYRVVSLSELAADPACTLPIRQSEGTS